MKFKYVAGTVAFLLMLGYLLPPVFKLKDVALGVVIIVGLAMMGKDLWDSFRSKED